MNKLIKYCLILAQISIGLAFTPNSANAHRSDNRSFLAQCIISDNGMDLDIVDGSLIFSSEEGFSTVEITDENELFIDNNPIRLNDKQQALVEEFRLSAEATIEQAGQLARKGIKLGVSGVRLGLSALCKVVKLVAPGYDADDLEREINRKARKLERRAHALEREADDIEDAVEELEDLARKLKRRIPELNELNWFEFR